MTEETHYYLITMRRLGVVRYEMCDSLESAYDKAEAILDRYSHLGYVTMDCDANLAGEFTEWSGQKRGGKDIASITVREVRKIER